MVTGTTVRTAPVTSARGRRVVVTLLKPDPTVDNIRALRETSERWHVDAAALRDGREQRRAFFAASAAFEAAAKLATPSCCVVVAEDEQGEVVGVVTYRPNGGSWHIEDMTLSPRNQANELNRDPLRGVGTAMLRVVAEDVQAGACNRLQLFTLDAEAERFWRARGFHDTVEPLHMTCPEVRELVAELSSSHPDRPDQGELVLVGTMARWRAVELPATRARLAL